ncbi:MAG: hypothetical protein OXI52_04585 [Caldilineaceae bacterium]|nr:hypothetical protein [Caldilineaceae bacterium]
MAWARGYRKRDQHARAGVGMPDPSCQRRDIFHLGPHPIGAGKVHLLAVLDSLCQKGGQQLDNRIVHLRPVALHFMAALLQS